MCVSMVDVPTSKDRNGRMAVNMTVSVKMVSLEDTGAPKGTVSASCKIKRKGNDFKENS